MVFPRLLKGHIKYFKEYLDINEILFFINLLINLCIDLAFKPSKELTITHPILFRNVREL